MKDFVISGHLQFLVDFPEAFTQRLLTPWPASWTGAESEEQYRDAIRRIESRFPGQGGMRDLWFLRRVAEYLAGHRHAPGWLRSFLSEASGWNRMFPGMDQEALLDGSWTAVPVMLVLGRQKALQYFIAGIPAGAGGRHRLWPEWADCLLDVKAADAVKQAAQAAMEQNQAVSCDAPFFCFPLAEPNRDCRIQGASLGLPLALGFRMVLEGREFPKWAAATGCVDSTGRIYSVSNAREKHTLAFEKDFSLFLYPAENCSTFEKSHPEAMAVENLSDAQVAATLFDPGNAAELVLLMKMKKDAQVFADNCLSVPGQWLAYILGPETCCFLKEQIQSAPGLLNTLLKNLESALSRYDFKTAQLLAALTDPADAGSLAEAEPASWFTWCTRNLALCNHRGDISSARRWADAADRVKPRAMAADDALKEMADYYNNQLVGMLHNQYEFRPVLPESFKNHLQHLETRFQSDLDYNPAACSGRLGELYGTLTQHFAFCGPAYLDKTLEYSRLARRAFGCGRAPDLRGAWRRQYNYLVYAFLDAKDFTRAESSLMTYLEADSWDAIQEMVPDLIMWDHASLARFIADTKTAVSRMPLVKGLVNAAREIVRPEHPWQVWHFNMGRIFLDAGEVKQAEAFFCKSLDLCVGEKFGPTVSVMALLPLSVLHVGGFSVNWENIEPVVRSAAMELSRAHFAFLDALSFPEALEYVYEKTSLVFPFAYR